MASESDPFIAFSDKEENNSIESLPHEKQNCPKSRWRLTTIFHVVLVVLYSAITASVLLINRNSCRTIYTDGRLSQTLSTTGKVEFNHQHCRTIKKSRSPVRNKIVHEPC